MTFNCAEYNRIVEEILVRNDVLYEIVDWAQQYTTEEPVKHNFTIMDFQRTSDLILINFDTVILLLNAEITK